MPSSYLKPDLSSIPICPESVLLVLSYDLLRKVLQKLPLEQRAGYASFFLFWWIMPLINKARKHQLTEEDVGPPVFKSEKMYQKFQAYLEGHPLGENHHLLAALYGCFPRLMFWDIFITSESVSARLLSSHICLTVQLHSLTKMAPVLLLKATLSFLK